MALVLTAAQMRATDNAIIEKLGLPGLVLMENAGRGVADLIERERPLLQGLDVRVVCGAGQNGGDGFVIARHLLHRGAKVQVLLALPAAKIAGDAEVFAKVFRKLAPDCVHDLSTEGDVKTWQSHLAGAAVVVDAIFGTGLRSDVTGAPAAAIAAINATDSLRVAVDIPSGLDADSGQAHGTCVHAHLTATMGCRKLGLVLDAAVPVGRVEIVDLGVAPESVIAAALERGPLAHWLLPQTVARLLPMRGPTGHKGSAGHLLVVAGSVGKTGAALLAARGALRTGAGLVTIATTASAQPALDAKVVAEMTAVYTQAEAAQASSYATLTSLATRMRAAVIGPGIPTGEGMSDLVRRLVSELPLPLVVDADALNLLGESIVEVAARAPAPRVLTPHPGEMARLCGCNTTDIQNGRLAFARRLADGCKSVVVLKGARTIVAEPDGTAFINPTANASLGTAGSGDVLAGVIGALLAQGLTARDAACAGVFVHGAAAETASQTLGTRNLVATDLPDAVAQACESLRPV
jgi:ADP-dependent NAD(P)H-hydrate dehydratase / NAD(P)H-hydrate epimerase